MGRADLSEAVARAIADEFVRVDGHYESDPAKAAAVAIGVVLAEAARSIEALRDEPHTTPPCRRAHDADDAYRRVLVVLAALVPPPLV